MVIRVDLMNHSIVGAKEMISFAAKGCYQPEKPEMGQILDIENVLFKVGHHTTLQHSYFTFWIGGIAVSDITFGLHLASPFYNSSQRSGRFCGKMFDNPDYEMIEGYIRTYWPEIGDKQVSIALDFVKSGIETYQRNLSRATEVAAQFIREDRPKATKKYIRQNAPKFAQEQLRVFIPTIFPTGDTFTINLSALVAMYHAAWTPAMRDVTQKMANHVLRLEPDFEYMFKAHHRDTGQLNWSVPLSSERSFIPYAHTSPKIELISIKDVPGLDILSLENTHPTDLLHFHPAQMNHSIFEVETKVEISVATMGQDQRHRTVRRSIPQFTGNFYLPPIVKECGLETPGMQMIERWAVLRNSLPDSLTQVLAPYGAMVRYFKVASFNAATHEFAKRLCWTAQEEIYNLALQLRQQIVEQKGKDSLLLKMFPPPCVRTGKCGEGPRYCGRDQQKDCFVKRKI